MSPEWLTSTEIRKALKLSGCQLMHFRESGKLVFKKVGNAYLYQLPIKQQGSSKQDAAGAK